MATRVTEKMVAALHKIAGGGYRYDQHSMQVRYLTTRKIIHMATVRALLKHGFIDQNGWGEMSLSPLGEEVLGKWV